MKKGIGDIKENIGNFFDKMNEKNEFDSETNPEDTKIFISEIQLRRKIPQLFYQ